MGAASSRTHDVFLSYSSKDKTWADAACTVLESHRVRCWIAPRDITPGDEWGAAIIKGLSGSRIMVLIFSGHANASPQVRREVERAISHGMSIVPVRIEDVRPEGAMEYALGNTHWLDAFTPPVEEQLELVARSVKTLLGNEVQAAASASSVSSPVTGDEPRKTKVKPRTDTKKDGLVEFRETASSNGADPAVAAASRRRRLVWLIAIVASLLGSIVLGAIMMTITTRNGETKITVADDSSSKADRDGTIAENDRSKNGPANHANRTTASSGAELPSPPPRNRIPPAGPARRAAGSPHGSWNVEGDQLIKEGPDTAWVFFGDQAWTDYDFTFEARKSAGTDSFGASFRGSAGDAYVLVVGGLDNKHVLRFDKKEIRSKPGTIQPLEWYQVKISSRGPHIRIELDDHVLFDLTDELSQHGRVALRCMNCAARFRNIKVAAPDGTILWEGPPDLPEK